MGIEVAMSARRLGVCEIFEPSRKPWIPSPTPFPVKGHVFDTINEALGDGLDLRVVIKPLQV